jgi:tetratricopeptide (TPR) repeat protein
VAFCAFAQQIDPKLGEIIRRHQSGDAAGAIPLYRDYLKAHPDSVDALANYGAALGHESQFDEAVVTYEKALKLQPGNPFILLNLALTYYKTGQFVEAKQRFEAALPKIPKNTPPFRQAALLLADCEIRLGRYKSAVSILEPLDQDPNDLGFAYLFGTALLKDQQTDRGAAIIDRILRKGDSAEARLLVGTVRLNSLDYTGARDELTKAVEMNPKLPEAHASLGRALLALTELQAATDQFHTELEIDPNNFVAVFQLGILAKQNESWDEARKFLTRALKLHPGDGAVAYQIALVDAGAGRNDDARRELEALLKESPDFTEAHVSLASIYYKLKRKEDGDREREIVRRLTAETQAKQPAARK